MKSRVYIVQERTRRAENGQQVSMLNLGLAEQYGELTRVLHGNDTRSPVDCTSLLCKLRDKLRDFNDDDYLLMAGSPLAMGLAMHVAMEINAGYVRVLSYDKVRESYDLFVVDLQSSGVTS